MDNRLRREIESVRRLKVKALKQRFLEVFGEPSPSSNRMHLFRRIAWRLQAQSEGDLSERARNRASQLAGDADLRLRAPKAFWQALDNPAAPSSRDPRLPPPGTELRRSYQGRSIVVKVLEQSFDFDGERYGSLSAIAYRATGTRWNGFLFFGLK